MLAAIWALILGVPSFIQAAIRFAGIVSQLVGIGVQIYKYLQVQYDVHERKAVATEIKEAVREQRQTLDNTRLNNIFNPVSEPYPARTVQPGADVVRSEENPKI